MYICHRLKANDWSAWWYTNSLLSRWLWFCIMYRREEKKRKGKTFLTFLNSRRKMVSQKLQNRNSLEKLPYMGYDYKYVSILDLIDHICSVNIPGGELPFFFQLPHHYIIFHVFLDSTINRNKRLPLVYLNRKWNSARQ